MFAIYVVLGVLYESFAHPFTVLTTLPSAGVGALLALMAFGADLSVVALIGIVLLLASLIIGAGWILRVRAVVELFPGYRMVFNTALCFALAGLAFAFNVAPATLRRRAQTVSARRALSRRRGDTHKATDTHTAAAWRRSLDDGQQHRA